MIPHACACSVEFTASHRHAARLELGTATPPARSVTEHADRVVRSTSSTSRSTSQPVPRRSSTTSRCASPSGLSPADADRRRRRGPESHRTPTRPDRRAASRVGRAVPLSMSITDAPDPSVAGQSPTPSRSTANVRASIDAQLLLDVLRRDPDPQARVRLRPRRRIASNVGLSSMSGVTRPVLVESRQTPTTRGRRATGRRRVAALTQPREHDPVLVHKLVDRRPRVPHLRVPVTDRPTTSATAPR
jgi:hypothetical protein